MLVISYDWELTFCELTMYMYTTKPYSMLTWEGERREERRRRKVEREGKEKRKEGVGKMI